MNNSGLVIKDYTRAPSNDRINGGLFELEVLLLVLKN